MAVTALISDLHLGSSSRSDLLRRGAIRERLLAALADVDRLVLLGDTIELRDGPLGEALARSRGFFEDLGEALRGRDVILVPGNHDHRLLGPWVENLGQADRAGGIAERVHSPHPALRAIAGWLGSARLEVRYPGLWVREDVYATHGHYLDSHITLPTVERLSVAAVDRLGGVPTGERGAVADYEQVHAPVYDLAFNLAQGGRSLTGRPGEGRSASMRIWQLLGGASGRARTIQGRVLGSAVLPVALRGIEWAGIGRFGRDFSTAEIGRAGVAAMHVVNARLQIGAEHVIFGHIHRRGALAGDDGSGASDPLWTVNGTTLHNTGNWIYVEALLGRAVPSSPFWPGSLIKVPESGPPELQEVLAEVDRDLLAGRRER